MLAAACRTRSHQPAKSGSSVDMKSAKAARRSALAVGSSTSGMRRVKGSSSTTMTGRRGTGLSVRFRLDVDPQRGEHPVVHQIGADEYGQLDDLALVVVLAHRVEHVVRHLRSGDHGVDIGERRALRVVEELRWAPILQRFAFFEADTIGHRDAGNM